MKYIFFTFLASISFSLLAQTSNVDINVNVKHTVGEVSSFDREKFITIHAGIRENDWTQNGSAIPSDIKNDFMNERDVYFGRNTGGITWSINSVLNEDPNRVGFVNLEEVKSEGKIHRDNYLARSDYYNYADRNNTHILATQYHPFWPDGTKTNKGWSFSQNDNENEPFGTASGEYCAHYIKEFFEQGSEKTPEYFEVINEPVYEMFGCEDCGETDEGLEQIFKYHNTVAEEVKKLNPTMKVGGYTTAFPNFDYNNFQRWEKRWNKFMDTCGDNMDFWSIHLYDWPTFNGKRIMRKGSNLEATLDLMDHASYEKFGVVKPTLVSEYGAQVHTMLGNQWSPQRDWHYLKSTNSMMMTFMDRADNIAKALPFIVLKATWGTVNGVPYNWRLLRKENEPENLTGAWVYTELLKFYDLWKDVKGTRVDHVSQNIDIQSDAYVDGNEVYIILNNLKQDNELVELKVNGIEKEDVQSVVIKHLYGDKGIPVLEELSYNSAPSQASLKPESTMIIAYTLKQNVIINESSNEQKYYASSYYKPIDGNEMKFSLSDINVEENGEAILRIGVGRAHELSLTPIVKVNNQKVEVPTNVKGDDQKERRSFFGVLEIPIDYSLIENSNEVSIQFPDVGGYVSSVNMRVYNFSLPINRSFNTEELPTSSITDFLFEDRIKVYPNPSKGGVVQVFFNGNILPEKLFVKDITGKLIKEHQVSSHEIILKMDNLKPGIYFIQAEIEGVQNTRKLIID